MTRIKVVSVLAVALVLTAFTASSAFAWTGVKIWVTVNCDNGKVVVHGEDNANHNLAHANPSTLTFTDSTGADIAGLEEVSFEVKSDTSVIATVDVKDFEGATGPFKVHLDADESVHSKTFTVECEHASPSPTETASPVATVSPSASAQPAATATASPSASATAAPTSTSVPSPPTTGQGSGSGGDNTFGIVLLAMVLGTVVIGGTTLALSRKGR